jgi:hypothetical protein
LLPGSTHLGQAELHGRHWLAAGRFQTKDGGGPLLAHPHLLGHLFQQHCACGRDEAVTMELHLKD